MQQSAHVRCAEAGSRPGPIVQMHGKGHAGASRYNTVEMSLQEALAALGDIQAIFRRKAEEDRELGVIVELNGNAELV